MARRSKRGTGGERPLLPRISKARLQAMIEEAMVDCYNESEQVTGWFTMIEQKLAVPFETMVLGVPVTIERVELNQLDSLPSADVVAIVSRFPSSTFRFPPHRLRVQSGSGHTATGAAKDDRSWEKEALAEGPALGRRVRAFLPPLPI